MRVITGVKTRVKKKSKTGVMSTPPENVRFLATQKLPVLKKTKMSGREKMIMT
jgi:hypothetical protein